MESGAPREPQGLGARARALAFGVPGTFDGAPVTRAIIWANVFVFVAELAFAHSREALLDVPTDVMTAFGGNLAPATIFDHRIETLLTSCFLHFSILHIGFNMVALRQVGPFVERAVGPARFATMYVLSGIAGSVGSALYWIATHGPSDSPRLSAGASGAVCGVIAAAMILGGRTEGWRGPIAQGMARWLGSIFVLGMIIAYANSRNPKIGGLDNAAHAGGALGGLVVAALWRRGVVRSQTTQRIIVALCAALCLAAGAVVVVRDVSDMFSERYGRTVAALSAQRCDDAIRGIEALNRLPRPTESERNAIDLLREKVIRRCITAPTDLQDANDL